MTSIICPALLFGPYFVVNLFLAVLKTKFGKAQRLFQSKMVTPRDVTKRNALAAAGGFLAAALRRYIERRRAAAGAREDALEATLLAHHGTWQGGS